ncbi:MAG TPA: hypothetical protein VGM41_20555 [Chitinophagaceae bacterium]|jgi:hypothetical protein
MSRNTTPATTTQHQKYSSVKKDAICLALVITAVFVLHIFSKNTVDQLYKAKVKDNAAVSQSPKKVVAD